MPPSQKTAIEHYITLLKEYNTHTNIYSKKAYDKLPFHIEDAATLATLCASATHILDIGSGSGLPSIILAILLPDIKITAVESKSRKTKFLFHVKQTLKLENLTVIQNDVNAVIRSRHLQPDTVTAKAFGSYDKIITICENLKKRPFSIIIPISKDQKEQLKDKKYLTFFSFEEKNCHYWKTTFK
jgi:16S rRNA (guanine527-N7)-methyltransferase